MDDIFVTDSEKGRRAIKGQRFSSCVSGAYGRRGRDAPLPLAKDYFFCTGALPLSLTRLINVRAADSRLGILRVAQNDRGDSPALRNAEKKADPPPSAIICVICG